MDKDSAAQLEAMVRTQITARGVRNTRVLEAMRRVPRQAFVPAQFRGAATSDEPLPIGDGQTISQPYIVAYMTEALALEPDARVLEIGTGSGYQTAVLAEIAASVYTVEILSGLAGRAEALLSGLGYRNIFFKTGDGTLGWEEFAPFDGILVAAAPAAVPPRLRDQLGPRGRMIIPIGTGVQELVRVVRIAGGFREDSLLGVRFVPLIHQQEGDSG
jgi:protein-L-isoaspartate(D-aspartate) O-methyltransferase